jgi:hypothetical protein
MGASAVWIEDGMKPYIQDGELEEEEEDWERDRDEEWLFKWPDERGEEEGVDGEEAGNAVAGEEN